MSDAHLKKYGPYLQPGERAAIEVMSASARQRAIDEARDWTLADLRPYQREIFLRQAHTRVSQLPIDERFVMQNQLRCLENWWGAVLEIQALRTTANSVPADTDFVMFSDAKSFMLWLRKPPRTYVAAAGAMYAC